MPNAAASRRTSAGKCSVSSQLSALGARRSSAKDFAMSRTARWSAVKANMVRFSGFVSHADPDTLPDVYGRRNRPTSFCGSPVLQTPRGSPPYAHLESFGGLVDTAKTQKLLFPDPPLQVKKRAGAHGSVLGSQPRRNSRSAPALSAHGASTAWMARRSPGRLVSGLQPTPGSEAGSCPRSSPGDHRVTRSRPLQIERERKDRRRAGWAASCARTVSPHLLRGPRLRQSACSRGLRRPGP